MNTAKKVLVGSAVSLYHLRFDSPVDSRQRVSDVAVGVEVRLTAQRS